MALFGYGFYHSYGQVLNILEIWTKRLQNEPHLYNINVFTGNIPSNKIMNFNGSKINVPEYMFKVVACNHKLQKNKLYIACFLMKNEPPKNKLRKVIFKYGNGMSKEEKLRIVGQLIGRSKKIHPDDIYELMLSLNHSGWKITIKRLAIRLNCSTRTIHRNMCHELRKEVKLLNKQNEEI